MPLRAKPAVVADKVVGPENLKLDRGKEDMVSRERWIVLVTATLTLTYSQVSSSRARIGKGFVAPRNISVEFYTIVSGITYNTNFVSPIEVPKRLEDVLNPKWKGKIASTVNAAIFDRVAFRPEWGIERMRAWFAQVRTSGL